MKSMLLLLSALIASAAGAQPLFPVRDAGEAPSRNFDVRHYRIEVAFNESTGTVYGKTTVTLVPFLPALSTVELDAEDLAVANVRLGTTPLSFAAQPKKLVIRLDRPYSFADTLALTVDYTAHPHRGLYFVHTDSLTKGKPSQIWTQGEDMDNHFWFPCVDFPDDFATSEVIATVKDSYQAVSNGRLVRVTADKKAHTKTFHWKQEIPHASYLIALAAGEYVVLRDNVGNVPLEYWVYPTNTEDAKVSFAATPDMVRWFSEKIGYPYPWAKYAQVLIRDFIEGGMENTSATFLTDGGSVFDARERVDRSSTSLIAHELAHQWWGDVVTCRDWRHLWLNESFASYFDPLWHEHALGRDEFDYLMYKAQQEGIRSDKRSGRKPIVSIGSYGSNLYPRGASVLHMLRFVLGDTLFWRGIHQYITAYQHRPVETNDFNRSIQNATGQNLTWFFEQWVYKAGYPIFDLSSTWNDSSRTLALAVRQTQTQDSLTGVFRTPVEIELMMPEGNALYRVTVDAADTTILIRPTSKPNAVVFDRGNWILKEVHWKKSGEEWEYLAEHAGNPIERIRATQAIPVLPGRLNALPVLARVSHTDAFWAVRREALIALSKFDSLSASDSALVLTAMLDAARDAKPEVRTTAVVGLGTFRGATVNAAVTAALGDSSINVVSAALRALAKVDSAHAGPVLLSRINDANEHSPIAAAALSALGSVDSSTAYAIALKRGLRGTAGDLRWVAFGVISRYGKGKRETREFFLNVLDEPRSWYRSAAVRSLGEIGTETELERLAKLTADENDPDSKTAKNAVDKIKKRMETAQEHEQ
jgi:aminopeptidase N